MDHLSAAGSSATRNLTTTEPSKSLNRRKTVDFRFQRPHATSGSFFFNKPMRAMDSRRDFTSKKTFSGNFSELGEKANSALPLSKVKQQVMGSMDQRVPWNQFIREAKVGHSGSPTCDCCGIRRWTCYKKCTSASALSPQLLLVRRESGCTGVCRSDSLVKLMQEERAHFRVDAIRRRKRGPFLSF